MKIDAVVVKARKPNPCATVSGRAWRRLERARLGRHNAKSTATNDLKLESCGNRSEALDSCNSACVAEGTAAIASFPAYKARA